MKTKYLLGIMALFALPLVGFMSGPSTGSLGLENPLTGNVKTLFDFVSLILNNIVIPVGSVVVVIYIIYTGFQFVTARGNESKLEDAKRSLLWVVIGTAILLGSLAIASVINGTLCEIAPNLPGCSGGSGSYICPPGSNPVSRPNGTYGCE